MFYLDTLQVREVAKIHSQFVKDENNNISI